MNQNNFEFLIENQDNYECNLNNLPDWNLIGNTF